MLYKIENIIKQSCWECLKKSKNITKSAKNRMNKKENKKNVLK